MKESSNSRTRIAYLNASVTLFGNVLQVIFSFVIRKLFINYLGVEYLGYNSVFQNVLQMLNLADLGIGIAITSFLYKPLAVNDRKIVSSLMYMYKKIYSILGIIVLCVGLVFTFFIQYIITDASCSIEYLRFLFLINLFSIVSTYYLSYKRTLLIADQKSYLTSLIDTVSYFVMSVFQTLILIFYPNYVLYLIITVAKNIISNLIVTVQCRRIYGNDKEIDHHIIDEYKPQVLSYVRDVFVSRIGAYVYYSTDNMIISIFCGSLLVGYLSNYTMIVTQVNNIISQILLAVQATFGNYISTNEDVDMQKQMTDNYLCINFCMGNFCMLCVMFLIQQFIGIFLGAKFVLEFSTVCLLAVNLMLTILIQIPSQIFMIYKLYHYDRPIIMISVATNIIISSVLVGKIGVNGVLIGTFVTSLFYLFSRFYIISRKVYNVPYFEYMLTILKYSITSIISIVVEYFVVRNISGITINSFGIRLVFVVVVALVVPMLCLIWTKEFSFFVRKINKIISARFRIRISNKGIVAICIALIIIFTFLGSVIHFNGSSAEPGNKSLKRVDSYNLDINARNNFKVFHLSFDDVIEIFKDINDHDNYDSIFDNERLSWFKELHDQYGVVISCYVFYENDDFSLNQCTTRFRDEFQQNSNWLRFGFHALNGNTTYGKSDDSSIVDDYNITIAALKKIVGNDTIDTVIRLHGFQATEAEVNALKNLNQKPVVGLLTADDTRQSYGLSESDNKYIYCHDTFFANGMEYISTDLRIEYIENIDNKINELSTDTWNNQTDYMMVFTHEWQINSEIKSKVEKLCKWAVDKNYEFKFIEDLN